MNPTPRENVNRNAFDGLFEMPAGRYGETLKADVFEQGDNYVIETDMPGFKKEDINIGYENGYLNIAAEKANNVTDTNTNYLRRERMFGQSRRSFYVGDIDDSLVKANFDNGTLKVIVPKKQLPNSNQKPISIE